MTWATAAWATEGASADTRRLGMHRLSTFAIGTGPTDLAVLEGISRARTQLVDARRRPLAASSGNLDLVAAWRGPSSQWPVATAALGTLCRLAGGRLASAQRSRR